MHQTATMIGLGLALAFAATGCRSHEVKIAELQKQYDQLGAQYRKDCSAEYLNVPPTLSPKCSAELKRLDAMSRRLQEERAKK